MTEVLSTAYICTRHSLYEGIWPTMRASQAFKETGTEDVKVMGEIRQQVTRDMP